MRSRITMCLAALAVGCLALAPVAVAQSVDIPRTPSGRPDLSGTLRRVDADADGASDRVW